MQEVSRDKRGRKVVSVVGFVSVFLYSFTAVFAVALIKTGLYGITPWLTLGIATAVVGSVLFYMHVLPRIRSAKTTKQAGLVLTWYDADEYAHHFPVSRRPKGPFVCSETEVEIYQPADK